MTYWQIIKQRRKSLRLSIDDISYQTRLAPEYIEAIEDNRLNVFRDNFSYVRYYIQNYCNAIGVNFFAIEEEVDANLNSYARRKNIAPPSRKTTQVKKKTAGAASTRSTGAKRTSSAKKRSTSSSTRKKTSSSAARRVSKNSKAARRRAARARARKRRLIQAAALLGAIILAGLIGVNFWMDQQSALETAQAEKERQEELARKEEETAKLAEQKKNGVTSTVEEQTLTVTNSTDGSNYFVVEDTKGNVKSLKFDIMLPEESTVSIYKNGELQTGNEDDVYTEEYIHTVSVENGDIIYLEIGSYDKGEITINNVPAEFDMTYWQPGYVAAMTFQFKTVEEENTDQENTDQENTDESEQETEEDASALEEEENVFDGNYDYSNNG